MKPRIVSNDFAPFPNPNDPLNRSVLFIPGKEDYQGIEKRNVDMGRRKGISELNTWYWKEDQTCLEIRPRWMEEGNK